MACHAVTFRVVSDGLPPPPSGVPQTCPSFVAVARFWLRAHLATALHICSAPPATVSAAGTSEGPRWMGVCHQTRAFHCSLGSVGSAVTHQKPPPLPPSGCCCTSEEEPGPGGNLVNGTTTVIHRRWRWVLLRRSLWKSRQGSVRKWPRIPKTSTR